MHELGRQVLAVDVQAVGQEASRLILSKLACGHQKCARSRFAYSQLQTQNTTVSNPDSVTKLVLKKVELLGVHSSTSLTQLNVRVVVLCHLHKLLLLGNIVSGVTAHCIQTIANGPQSMEQLIRCADATLTITEKQA